MKRAPIFVLLILALTAAQGPAQSNSVLPHGDFEQADAQDKAKAAGWDRVDGLGVQWTNAPDAAHGKAIRMDTRVSEQAMQAQWVRTGLTNLWNIPKPEKNPIAETYGLSLYSDPIPVKPGQPTESASITRDPTAAPRSGCAAGACSKAPSSGAGKPPSPAIARAGPGPPARRSSTPHRRVRRSPKCGSCSLLFIPRESIGLTTSESNRSTSRVSQNEVTSVLSPKSEGNPRRIAAI